MTLIFFREFNSSPPPHIKNFILLSVIFFATSRIPPTLLTFRIDPVYTTRNILDFSKNLPKVLDMLEKPDVIVSTTFDPFTCYAGIKYARKYGITAIAEIADLWPEVLIVYNKMNLKNPLIRYLRNIEKKIYTQADRVVFTAAGEYEYIIEQGWEKELPKSKFGYINNGIDIELYNNIWFFKHI